MRNLTIIFLHIEKTGGMTIHSILHNNRIGYITPSPSVRLGNHISKAEFDLYSRWYPLKIDGIGGHRVRTNVNYFDKPTFTFTFMRDPISRFISHYNWKINIENKKWSIEEFCELEEFSNFQTYRICGEKKYESAISSISNDFSFIGMFEQFNLSLIKLNEFFSDTLDVRYQIKNQKKYTNQKKLIWKNLSTDQRKKIIKANEIDLKIYHVVKDKFEKMKIVENNKHRQEIQYNPIKNKNYYFPCKTIIKQKISNIFIKSVGHYVNL